MSGVFTSPINKWSDIGLDEFEEVECKYYQTCVVWSNLLEQYATGAEHPVFQEIKATNSNIEPKIVK